MRDIISTERQTDRESGIELLKIIAVIFIIISHVAQTLILENAYVSCQDYVLDLSSATTDIQQFVLTVFRYFGVLGNDIFFICSAWFLLRSQKWDKKKWFFMLTEIWAVSVIILLVTYALGHGGISIEFIVKSLLPTTFGNNWYLTCYLLFYPLHPVLNGVIGHMNKKSLFRITVSMLVLYFGFNFIYRALFFPSVLILWITVYFVVAYMRLHMSQFSDSVKGNLFLLAFGIVGWVGLAGFINYLGLRFSFLEHKMLYWASNCNPFLLACSLALFNLARKARLKSCFVNRISKLSLLIYIIHENIILRTYYRPYLLNYVHATYGYDFVLAWVLGLAVVIFLFSAACSAVYEMTLRKIVKTCGDALYRFIRKSYLSFERRILK